MVNASGWGPVVGDGEGLTNRLVELLAEKYRVVVAADGDGSAQRLAPAAARPRPRLRDRRRGHRAHSSPAGVVAVAPLHRGCIVPGAKVAIVAEGDLTGRRRTHRQPRARKRAERRLLRGPEAGNYVVHHQHGVGQYEGMVKRTIGGDRARLPAARVQGRRQALHPERPDRHDPPVRRRRGTGAAPPRRRRLRQGQGQGQVRRARDRPGAGACCTRSGSTRPATRSASTRRGSTTWRTRSRTSRRPIRRTAIDDTKADMERAFPMDRLRVRRRRLRQDRGRDAGGVQGDPGRQAGRGARADHAAGHPARQHVRRSLLRLPDPRRGAQPVPHQRGGQEGDRRAWPAARSTA